MKENWIIPCNFKQLNLRNHLLNTDEVVFKEIRPKNIGDTAYIYVSGIKGQEGQIKYKGTVIDNHCSQELINKHSYAVLTNSYSQGPFVYMLIKIVGEFPDGAITYSDMKEHDFGQVRVQTRTTRQLQVFLNKKEKYLVKLNHNQ